MKLFLDKMCSRSHLGATTHLPYPLQTVCTILTEKLHLNFTYRPFFHYCNCFCSSTKMFRTIHALEVDFSFYTEGVYLLTTNSNSSNKTNGCNMRMRMFVTLATGCVNRQGLEMIHRGFWMQHWHFVLFWSIVRAIYWNVLEKCLLCNTTLGVGHFGMLLRLLCAVHLCVRMYPSTWVDTDHFV